MGKKEEKAFRKRFEEFKRAWKEGKIWPTSK